jgi:hypothetical protein
MAATVDRGRFAFYFMTLNVTIAANLSLFLEVLQLKLIIFHYSKQGSANCENLVCF